MGVNDDVVAAKYSNTELIVLLGMWIILQNDLGNLVSKGFVIRGSCCPEDNSESLLCCTAAPIMRQRFKHARPLNPSHLLYQPCVTSHLWSGDPFCQNVISYSYE